MRFTEHGNNKRSLLTFSGAAAFLLLLSSPASAWCPYDLLSSACWQAGSYWLPTGCPTTDTCDCRLPENKNYYPCTLSGCMELFDDGPLPCAAAMTTRGETGLQLEAGRVSVQGLWVEPETQAKIAAMALLQRGNADAALREHCLENTADCLEASGGSLLPDYSLEYVTDDSGRDQVIVSRGGVRLDELQLPTEAELQEVSDSPVPQEDAPD